MTQEEKELLLKDLCTRFPYGVKCKVHNKVHTINAIYDDGSFWLNDKDDCYIEEIKPYLRPMSSMTEEESKEYRMFIDYSYNDFTSENTPCVYTNKVNDYIDWLNAHYFDYRGLIEKGLALEAPEDMYKN